jgi:large subunit ribosomal protein L22e
VDNRTGNLGDSITISRDEGKIVVVANGEKFSGRYLKYLTKKFLKKQSVF